MSKHILFTRLAQRTAFVSVPSRPVTTSASLLRGQHDLSHHWTLKDSEGKSYPERKATGFRQTLGSTLPPMPWVPAVKRPGREADRSPSASAEVKKMWMYTSTPQYAFMTFIDSFNSFYFIVEHRTSTKDLQRTVPSQALDLSPGPSWFSGLFINSSPPSCSRSTSPSLPLVVPAQSLPLYCSGYWVFLC
jgi:hypothetical protein